MLIEQRSRLAIEVRIARQRQVVRRIKDRLRSRFNVAVAEVGELDWLQRAEIGIVCVGNDQKYLNGILSRALDMVNATCDCEIGDVDMEFT